MSVHIFISYAHDEYEAMNRLRTQLQHATNAKAEIRTDEQLIPGQEWDREIREALQEAHINLFLISKKFVRSRYIKEVELRNAIERYQKKEVVLIPVLLEKMDAEEYKNFPLYIFEPLPVENKKEKPVSEWEDQSKAYENIVAGIERAITSILMSKAYNAAIIKEMKNQYKKANFDTIFKALQKMELFIEATDRGLYKAYAKLAGEWKTNKMDIIRRTRDANEQRDYILNSLQDYLYDLEAAIQEN